MMKATPKTLSMVLLAAGGILLIACGGSGRPATAGTPEAGREQPAASASPAPKGGKPAGAPNTKGPGSNLDFSGAIDAKTDDVGACGMQFGFKTILSVPVGDDLMFFQIIVPRFKGAASYSGDLLLTNGAGTSWSTDARHKATVLVNGDERSGTVEGTLFNKEQGTETQVTGAWRCEA